METNFFQNSLPKSIAQEVTGYAWTEILTGHSASQVFLLQKNDCENLYLKIARAGDARSDLIEEKTKLEWLKGKLSVPEVRFFAVDENHNYLLLSTIDGFAASDDRCASRPRQIIEQLAEGLAIIHNLPIEDCPFDERLKRKIQLARRNVERNLVDEEDFDEHRLGRTAEDLFQELIASQPTDEDLVFTHGDYCLPNIILKDFDLSGFVDWGRAGIADRYQDVALLARSIESNFGSEWLPFLFENLSLEPDREKINFYQLLDEFF